MIGGWLPGRGQRRERIGALLVGCHTAAGELRFAGRVGTGFTDAELDRLAGLLGPLEQAASPFAGRQPPAGAVHVSPALVAEVEFSEWTAQGPAAGPVLQGAARRQAGGRRRLRGPRRGPPTTPARHGPAGGPPRRRPYEILRETPTTVEVAVDGRTLKLSNRAQGPLPGRPASRRAQMIDYYVAIGPTLVRHTAGRPLTLKRYPDGVDGKYFYEKRCPTHRPDWVATAPVWSGRGAGEIDYCLANELPTLVWAANLASIELHTSLSLADDLACPTAVVFDLDPGDGADVLDCARVAVWLRDLFAAIGLETLVKSSGSKGLQAYVPLNIQTSYEVTKPFAQAVAELLERQHPELVVSRMGKHLRPDRVFIDWSQNDQHKTTVSVYSLRAGPRPTVSAPLHVDRGRAGARRRRPRLAVHRGRRDGRADRRPRRPLRRTGRTRAEPPRPLTPTGPQGLGWDAPTTSRGRHRGPQKSANVRVGGGRCVRCRRRRRRARLGRDDRRRSPPA